MTLSPFCLVVLIRQWGIEINPCILPMETIINPLVSLVGFFKRLKKLD
jgi:hypothetical protein